MDPIYTCQLALRLGMPIGEMGQRMSAYEMCVVWPAFFRWEQREKAREHREAELQRRGR
jgi:hypothetical protein